MSFFDWLDELAKVTVAVSVSILNTLFYSAFTGSKTSFFFFHNPPTSDNFTLFLFKDLTQYYVLCEMIIFSINNIFPICHQELYTTAQCFQAYRFWIMLSFFHDNSSNRKLPDKHNGWVLKVTPVLFLWHYITMSLQSETNQLFV